VRVGLEERPRVARAACRVARAVLQSVARAVLQPVVQAVFQPVVQADPCPMLALHRAGRSAPTAMLRTNAARINAPTVSAWGMLRHLACLRAGPATIPNSAAPMSANTASVSMTCPRRLACPTARTATILMSAVRSYATTVSAGAVHLRANPMVPTVKSTSSVARACAWGVRVQAQSLAPARRTHAMPVSRNRAVPRSSCALNSLPARAAWIVSVLAS